MIYREYGGKVLVSKKIIEDIDLEEGKIRVGDKWLTEDEIRYIIKMKVDSDDYNVADLAVALQTLISELNKSAVLRVRVPKEMAEEFEKLSKEKGESVQSVLRTILIDYLNTEVKSPEEQEEEETIIYEDVDEEEPEEEYEEITYIDEDEGESDEDILGEKEDDIDIRIEEEDLVEDRDSELLEIDTTIGSSETVEVEAEDDFDTEYIPDIEELDEEESEKIAEESESEKVVVKRGFNKNTPEFKSLRREMKSAEVVSTKDKPNKKTKKRKKVIIRKKKIKPNED